MERRTWVILTVVVAALVSGLVFANLVVPRLQDLGLQTASDAGRVKGTISVAGDNYLGYWFLNTREFTQRLRQKGYAIRWTNDGGNYAERHRKFNESQYDVMVLPISSYLQHGAALRFPGVIPAAISESKGADSIVAYTEKVSGGAGRTPAINDLNNPNLKICVTPDSPSTFLLHVAIAHFALDELRQTGPWNVATKGSDDALGKLRGRQCDAAVLWEPDVSKALAIQGVTPIFGSDQVSEMIVDVFVVRRQLARDNPELVDAFFSSYFETVSHYSSRRDEMVAEIARDPAIGGTDAAGRAVSRIAWFGLDDNCRDWFNVGLPGIVQLSNREKAVDSITQVTKVMMSVGDLGADPLNGNPYAITNSDVLGRLCSQLGTGSPGIGVVPVRTEFPPLGDDEWNSLRVIGRLRVLPISFDASTSRLTREGQTVVDQVATALVQNYPQYRVVVKGHTSPAGDEAANVALSEERAQAVRSYLASTHHVDPNRLRAQGVGSREPLPRIPGEGELAYRNRLARVEVLLLEPGR
jgi:hypothetical protein